MDYNGVWLMLSYERTSDARRDGEDTGQYPHLFDSLRTCGTTL